MTTRRAKLLEATCRVIALRGVRGLRVEDVAAEAGVSKTLIYYHFRDRAGLVTSALDYVNDRAESYADVAAVGGAPIRELLLSLLAAEFQDDTTVRENSAVWGEVRAAATFEDGLRPTLASLTERWLVDVAELIEDGQDDGSIPPTVDSRAVAVRLTSLVEGLSGRWLAGLLSTAEARAHVAAALERELAGSPQG
ncbi:TetR/AcrR family transcriptional regulator [Streptomyces noursei]|uniref:TetR/AcrR family transcriptional regulator n=1 Tax=Streptomyces TaxID=1883 RepID=UPI00043674AA|nr:TetR/AcrR family transcriptional regulator [Streptomyces noursei]AKA07969.1 TetR family transcriptional regulator [Streptomyces noursei ZPM]EXU90140.1 TetR family transcriptional regulator [Streptomyces noursei PD-1]MCZ0973655.1 TetR/AcrR family transcriptional regulator [Streptomyces noursei]UWS76584.1 TetR/AcrR family transcriptional regulator [Streptomyces noursei]